MIDLKINCIVAIIIFAGVVGTARQYLGYRLNITSLKISQLVERINDSSSRTDKFYLRSMIVLKFLDYLNLVLIIIFLVIPIFMNFIKHI